MKEFIRNNIKLIFFLMVVILLGGVVVTFAFNEREIGVTINTGEYNVIYTGTSTLPSSNLSPVPDSSVRLAESQDKVLKVEFTVKGAQNNPTDKPIIYDVSLSDLNLPEQLKNNNFKWRLYKNSKLISEGTFKDGYDEEDNSRMVLTYTQQDLPNYDKNVDSYVFYGWLSISEACNKDITNCTEEEISYSSSFMNKTFSGNIRIELSTGAKITRVMGEAGKTITKLGLEDSIKTDIPNFLNTSCSNGCQESTVGIYRTFDDLGISYYFRGNVTNNYVKFAGYYWRIVRINGDGTIRMIYDGTKAHENGEVSEDRVLDIVRYNNYAEDVSFVGYMNGTVDGEYFPNGTTNSTSKSEAHANISDSNLKKHTDTWYEENIKDTDYEQYVADAIYCNERNISTLKKTTSGVNATDYGYGNYTTIFSTFDHDDVKNDEIKNRMPRLYCQNLNDRFTNGNNLGNGKLKYSIGHLTLSEADLSGLQNAENKVSYLYTGHSYWTMTPSVYIFINAKQYGGFIFTIDSNSVIMQSFYLDDVIVDEAFKPVVSLKTDVLKFGDGTKDNPFRITEEI